MECLLNSETGEESYGEAEKSRIVIKNTISSTTNPTCDSHHNKYQWNRYANQNTRILYLDK